MNYNLKNFLFLYFLLGLGGGILKTVVLFWVLELTKCCRFIGLLFGLGVVYVQSQIVTVSTAQ